MGGKPVENREKTGRITVDNVPASLGAQLSIQATARGIPRSALIKMILHEWMMKEGYNEHNSGRTG